MAKTKVSFDIDKKDLDDIKELIKNLGITQGDFFRQLVQSALKKHDDEILRVYLLEENTLVCKSITKSEYLIEYDRSDIAKELLRDFNFVTTGFLIKNGVKTRFYSKVMLD